MNDHYEGRPRSDSADIALRKIFIGGLSYSTDEEKLRKYFRAYGTVQDAVVMKDPISKRSRGFGFITFYEISSVDHVLANEPHTIDARKVEAKRAVPRAEMNAKESVSVSSNKHPATTPQNGALKPSTPQSSPQITPMKSSNSPSDGMEKAIHDSKLDDYAYNKIFVGGLHYDTRDADFRSYFERFGTVISAEVMFNRETHKSRGFGFVVFETEETAIKVCQEKEHLLDGKVVEVKRAIPRSKIASSHSHSQLNALSPPSSSSHTMMHSTPMSLTKAISPTEHASPDTRVRALSAGNHPMLTTPPGNTTSTSVTPTHGVLSLKPPQVNVVGSQLPPTGAKRAHTPNSMSSIPLTSHSSGNSATAAASFNKNSSSYISALKLGGSLDEQQQQQQQRNLFLNSSNLGSGIDSFSMNINNNTSSSNLQSLLQSTSREIDVRQSRALSEPIKFDNSFAFSQDMFDLNSLRGVGSSGGLTNLDNASSGSGIANTMSADHPPSEGRGAGLGSFSWLGSPVSNKFDAILDANNQQSSSLGGIAAAEFTRHRSHSLGPTTIASSSRSPGLIGYPSFASFSQETFLSETAAPPAQSPLAFGLQPSTNSLQSVENNNQALFSTPSRSLSGVFGEGPAGTGMNSLKQKSPGPSNEWNSVTGSSNSALMSGSLLGLLGEGTSLLHDTEGAGLFSSDSRESRVLSISKFDPNEGLLPQRRHSHPLLPSQDLYDTARINEVGNNINSFTGGDANLWSRR